MITRKQRLLGLIDAVDESGLVAFLAPLSEAERAALAPTVGQRVHELKALEHSKAFRESESARQARAHLPVAFLAWLGTADLATLPPPPVEHDRDHMRWYLHRACASGAGHQILADRRPTWLAELANQHLDYGGWMWDPVWRLVLAGLIERPTSPTYLRGLALYAGAGRSRDERLDEMVRRDPDLLDRDLPALLDLPDGLISLVKGDVYDAYDGPDRQKYRVWSPILRELPPGHPIRERLLTGVLDALGGDVDRDAVLFHSFLTELRPSAAELSARRRQLLRLVGHRVPVVVSVALRLLSTVDKVRGLDPVDVVATLGPATGASSEATARAAVRLIGRAVRRKPELAAAAAGALAPALSHRRPDVQADAVRLLLAHAGDAAAAATLSSAAAHLSPVALAHLPRAAAVETPTAKVMADDVIAEAEALRQATCDTDLAAAITAVRAGGEPPAVIRAPWRDARPTAERVTPVSTVDELIETLLIVIDRQARATSVIERALDGLAALAGDVPDDFGRRVSPLLARVHQIFASDRPSWGDHYSSDFCFLIAKWIEPHRPVARSKPLRTQREWLIGRVREVALVLHHRVRARLLALPTDEADWIEPAVLAERVIAVGDDALSRPLDVIIALARLAPWGRPAAMDRLRDAPGSLAAAVRAVLGNDDENLDGLPELIRRAVAWRREGRSRGGVPYLFGEPAPPDHQGVQIPHDFYSRTDIPTFPLPDGGSRTDPTGLPEWQAHVRWIDHRRDLRYGSAWAISQWPADGDWVWDDDVLSRRELRSLVDPEAALPPAAVARVVECLGDDLAELRTLAADVVAQAISDGRLTSRELGQAITQRSTSDERWGRVAGRLAVGLAEVASLSALHRAVVVRALTASVVSWCGVPAKPLCALLEVLDENLISMGQGLALERARAALEPLARGRSKTARLADRVLAHPPTEQWPQDAALIALFARIERARQRV